jgi:hypothetical protein
MSLLLLDLLHFQELERPSDTPTFEVRIEEKPVKEPEDD